MDQFTRSWPLLTAAMLLTLSLLPHIQIDAAAPTAADIANANTDASRTVKKALPPAPPTQAPETAVPQSPAVVVISEKPQQQLIPKAAEPNDNQPAAAAEDVLIQRSKIGKDDEFPDSFAAVFYVMVGLTSSAILLLVVRIYRLRLSRAERKYGVQGDRANQELTPLPMAIEDVNSDEDEDQTLFEVNRQSIRIL
ncbi:membrane protein FAM174A [Drosophila grimshawi]|uniref:GH20586 n=1 Tax=Drosophila grimshawi TaxID=7222 RepID=B4J855_DROGR|nr:membrane protein FAM174A [Drosophila grimshawi]EDW01192.1 GH20586 [Drosophila grimshawi]